MTTWRMRITCWITEAANTVSECVILIAFPLQEWLHEGASILRHKYASFLVILRIVNYILCAKFCMTYNSFDIKEGLFENDFTSYTGCPTSYGHYFGTVFLMLKYTDITQNTYVQSWTVTEIMAREVWNFDSCYTLINYQIHIKTGRNMWFL